ncbi:MAG: hypothetical protein AMXMBFR84_35230 [Candidatus Hydrogenedentota bacterium]
MKTVVVTGDVMVDHHLYEGKRLTASATDQPGFKVCRQHGGAMAVCDLVNAVINQSITDSAAEMECKAKAVEDARQACAKDSEKEAAQQKLAEAEEALQKHKRVRESDWKACFGLTTPLEHEIPCGHHALSIWKPFQTMEGNEEKKVWRADLLMGYGHDDAPAKCDTEKCEYTPKVLSPPPPRADVLVLDDGGFIFRHRFQRDCWLLPSAQESKPHWIVMKMSGPVCQGDLWSHLKTYGDRLIVVVSANDLRQECVHLGEGLSWERTVEELRDALLTNPALSDLVSVPRHLIVLFSADGALWLDRSGEQLKATLVFDAGGIEGWWGRKIEGKAFGYMSCMVASVVRAAMHDSEEPAIDPAVRAGLAAMRDLARWGHGEVNDGWPSGFPCDRLARVIVRGGSGFAVTRVPWSEAERNLYAPAPENPDGKSPWRIVETSQCPFGDGKTPSLLGLASQVVIYGELAIRALPHARFRNLLTADRIEIEALRSIEVLMNRYLDETKPKRPLSIGVFGPPGAGKSFGVRQLADDIFGAKAWLEFNLSQFKDSKDLIGAFHQVRDTVLSGQTPTVFWDEFDSREYEWLQYLLAPMQDGRFQEGQISHYIGKCVFIFAGATAYSFNEFGPAKPPDKRFDADAWKKFSLRKGPDFHSRLDAYYDVLGPNPRTVLPHDGCGSQRVPDPTDVCYPLRRALLIRSLLKAKNSALDFDPELLHALLQTAEYTHGARSLEKLVTALIPTKKGQSIRRSALPPPAQLAMHVTEPEQFIHMLGRHVQYRNPETINAIAQGIHETWRELSAIEHWKMQPAYDMPYELLGDVEKDENRAAARRIPDILALAGLRIEQSDLPHGAGVEDQLKQPHQLRRLAEAEHERWMAHRIKNGWRYSEQRDDAKKLHHALVPYADLAEADQKKDQNSVKHFPEMLRRAGYRIVWA